MIQKRTLIGILLVVALLGIVPALSMATPPTSPPAQEGQPTNLLQNPGFEGITCRPGSVPPECLDNWSNSANHDGSTHGNIFTPQGWTTWWRTGGDYGQPEVKTFQASLPNMGYGAELPRLRSGHYAVMLFNFYRLQDTGLYQCVSGIEAGATVQMSAYAHGWSCDKDKPMGYTCSDPWNQTFQVGIEPNGLADPFSASVIWSEKQQAPDHYKLIGPLTAQAGAGGRVCVFLRSKTKWMYKYQDAYWDDTSLVVTVPGTPPTNTPPPPPPPPTAGPPPTPRATATPYPDGSVVHTVQPGDTLFGIALMYGVDVNQIRQLNASALGGSDMIYVNQKLVVAPPSQAITPTQPPPPEQPTPAETGANPPVPNPENPAAGGATGGASICVLAFHDRNGDTFRDETTEELLPNAEFTLANASGVIAQYTSNGVNEPYCFTGLATGAYRVIQNSPPGYVPSGPAEWAIPVPAEDTSLDVQFGNARGEGTTDTGEATETAPTESESGSGGSSSSIFSTLAKVSGVLVLLLAAGMAVLFVINRQRM